MNTFPIVMIDVKGSDDDDGGDNDDDDDDDDDHHHHHHQVFYLIYKCKGIIHIIGPPGS